MTHPVLMQSVAKHDLVEGLIQRGIVRDEHELMVKCKFFFHIEKLYHLIKRAEISPKEREGLNREIELWLSIKGMQDFFDEFCKKAACYSSDFLREVDRFYKGGVFAQEMV